MFFFYYSDSEEEANEVFEEAIEEPLTLDETRKLAETWTRRYSKAPEDKQNGESKDDRREEEDDETESLECEESDEDFSCPEYESEGEMHVNFFTSFTLNSFTLISCSFTKNLTYLQSLNKLRIIPHIPISCGCCSIPCFL